MTTALLEKSGLKLERALQIEGFMPLPELEWLAWQATQHQVIVEVGAFLGRTTRVLGDNTAGMVYALDDWFGPRDAVVEDRPLIFKRFLGYVGDLVEEKKVRVFTGKHENGLPGVEADMVFLDGDHLYRSVKRDLETFSKNLLPGGLMCGDDFDREGVRRAVVQVYGHARVQVVPGTRLWWIGEN